MHLRSGRKIRMETRNTNVEGGAQGREIPPMEGRVDQNVSNQTNEEMLRIIIEQIKQTQEQIKISEEKTQEQIKISEEKTQEQIKQTQEQIKAVEKNIKQQNEEQFRILEDKLKAGIRREIADMQKNVEEEIYHKQNQLEIEIRTQMEEQRDSNHIEIDNVRQYVEQEVTIQKTNLALEETQRKSDVEGLREEIRKEIDRSNSVRIIGTAISDNCIKFDGDIKKVHPKMFLQILGNKIRGIRDMETIKDIIRINLSGHALLWFTSKNSETNTYEEFEKYFIGYFWGENNQTLVRERLYFGKFDYTRGSSLNHYALQLFTMAKFLDPPLRDEEIIISIARQFKPEVAETVALQNIKNYEQFSSYLLRIERSMSNISNNDTNYRRSYNNTNYNQNRSGNYYQHNYINNNRGNFNNNYPRDTNYNRNSNNYQYQNRNYSNQNNNRYNTYNRNYNNNHNTNWRNQNYNENRMGRSNSTGDLGRNEERGRNRAVNFQQIERRGEDRNERETEDINRDEVPASRRSVSLDREVSNNQNF